MSDPPRFGSLFSGIGGFDLGLERAGWECAWQVEIDEACQRVLSDTSDLYRATGTLGKYQPPLKLSTAQVQEAVYLYQQGYSCGDLAERYGVSRQSMWDLLRRRTVMRPRERYGKENTFWRSGRCAQKKAGRLVWAAIKRGELTRKTTCEECGKGGTFKDGRSAIQAHHPDYNAPLDVMWLCQPCHHRWHQLWTAKEVV